MSQYQMSLAHLEDDMKMKKEELNSSNKSVQTIVDRETIAALISKQTGVPAQKIMAAESESYLILSSIFKGESLVKTMRLLQYLMPSGEIDQDFVALADPLHHFYF